MALILLIIGAVLFYTERFNLGGIQTQGRHVKAAGVVLMLPSTGAFILSLLIGLFFSSDMDLVYTLLQVVSLAETLAIFAAVAIAYILVANPANAPHLPGILGQIQAGIGTEHPVTTPQRTPTTARTPQNVTPTRDQVQSKRIMSVNEAAVYLGMTEIQVIQLIDEGKLPAARANYRYQIARSQLDEILKTRDAELV